MAKTWSRASRVTPKGARIGEGIETIEVVAPSLPTPVTLPSLEPAKAPATTAPSSTPVEPELVPVGA